MKIKHLDECSITAGAVATVAQPFKAVQERSPAKDKPKGSNLLKGIKTSKKFANSVAEGAKVDRMVGHIKSSEKKLGKSSKEAENIAWATANKRGMLDNKNKKNVAEGLNPQVTYVIIYTDTHGHKKKQTIISSRGSEYVWKKFEQDNPGFRISGFSSINDDEQGVAEGELGIEDMVMDQYYNGNEVSEIARYLHISEDEVQDIIDQHEVDEAQAVAQPQAPAAVQQAPVAPAPEEPETDPELRSAEQSANVHYSSVASRRKAIEKYLLRATKHGKESDMAQNQELRKIERDLDAIRKMVSKPVAEGEINEDDVVMTPGKGNRLKPGLLHKPEPTMNPADTVKVDVPLLIRLLEYAREDAKTDMDLHDLAEKLIALGARGRTLTMKDYERLVPETKPEAPMDEEQAVLTKPEWLSKRKVLQDLQMDPETSKDPVLKKELFKKIADLKRRAEEAGLSEEVDECDFENMYQQKVDEISDPMVKNYLGKAVYDTLTGKKDRNPGIKRAMNRLSGTNKPLMSKPK